MAQVGIVMGSDSDMPVMAKAADILEELGDTLEVIKYLAQLEGKTLEDVIEISNQKRLKRGGFDKRIFLISTSKK